MLINNFSLKRKPSNQISFLLYLQLMNKIKNTSKAGKIMSVKNLELSNYKLDCHIDTLDTNNLKGVFRQFLKS